MYLEPKIYPQNFCNFFLHKFYFNKSVNKFGILERLF